MPVLILSWKVEGRRMAAQGTHKGCPYINPNTYPCRTTAIHQNLSFVTLSPDSSGRRV